MHLASQKTLFRAVSTRGKLKPHVAPPISLTNSTDWKMVCVNKLINVFVGSFCACNLEICDKNNYFPGNFFLWVQFWTKSWFVLCLSYIGFLSNRFKETRKKESSPIMFLQTYFLHASHHYNRLDSVTTRTWKMYTNCYWKSADTIELETCTNLKRPPSGLNRISRTVDKIWAIFIATL